MRITGELFSSKLLSTSDFHNKAASDKKSITQGHCKEKTSAEILSWKALCSLQPFAAGPWTACRIPHNCRDILRESYLLSSEVPPTSRAGFSPGEDYTATPILQHIFRLHRHNFLLLPLSSSHLCVLSDLIQSQEFKIILNKYLRILFKGVLQYFNPLI